MWYNGKREGAVYVTYAIIALVLLAALAGWLAWRLRAARQALADAQKRARGLRRERAQRQNLQHVCDSRAAEIKRLRERIDRYEADVQEMETRASDLNMNLFRESGLRILAEKEDGAKRLKMDQLERQLDDAKAKLRARDAEAKEREAQLLEEIAKLQEEIDRIRAAHARRAARRAQLENGALDQVTLEDVLKQKIG